MTPTRGSNYSFLLLLTQGLIVHDKIRTSTVFQEKYFGNYILSHHTLNGIKLQFFIYST